MEGPNSASWICTASACLVIGCILAIWGVAVLANPSRVKKDSLVYRWWSRGTNSRRNQALQQDSHELSSSRVRLWSLMAVITGVYLALTGVYGILRTLGVIGSLF